MEVLVPDLGDFKDVPVIEVLVKPGDRVKKNDSLVTLESDKASMEVPSSADGTVQEVRVRVGDRVSQGSVIVTLSGDNASQPQPSAGSSIELKVPDIGDFHDIPVIDVMIKPGDTVKREAPLVTLESEKASMDVPSTADGTIEDVRVKPGDKVSQGTVIATLRALASFDSAPSGRSAQDDKGRAGAVTRADVAGGGARGDAGDGARGDAGGGARGDAGGVGRAAPLGVGTQQQGVTLSERSESKGGGIVHASPSVRRFARELGVDLHGVDGSGPNERITREDVQRFVKRALTSGAGTPQASTAFAGLPAWPKVDFAQFGPVERQALPRIKKLSGPNLHRNWLQIPHITNYDEADVTELEAFRNAINTENAKAGGAKLTMLAFLIKASVAALKRFREFNSSLEGDELVYKRYYNIGFAADTPNGLVVPVLKNADGKGLLEIARESAELAAKARDGKLGMADMQGGTFTISSIGSIGGTQFTQIVNAPEVAILGATRAAIKPVWDGSSFVPRLIQPISVSYDHRVIDGAGAARFLAYVASLLHDFKRVLL